MTPEVVGVSIAGTALLGTLIGFCINNASRQGKNENRIENLESRLTEKITNDREKFTKLYTQQNELSTLIATMNANLVCIMNDIKEIKEDFKGKKNNE